jgi:hypothetical protein
MSSFKYIVVFILIFISGNIFAQKGSVSGKIVDAENNAILEYASVAVYRSDSVLVNGTITDETGNFKIGKLKDGAFYLRVQFLGYETLETERFTVFEWRNTDLGEIKVKPSAQLMEEISVSGVRANSTNQLEKQTYSSEQFESAKGGTALDVL